MVQTDCPYGRVNDPYPGLCPLYTDKNGNQVCDFSEPKSNPVSYQPFWFLFIPLALYFLHWYLTRKTDLGKRIWIFSPAGFKYFWNLVLLFLFLPAGLSGLLVYLGLSSPFLINWHNNLGASFVLVALIHLVARLNYYLGRFRRSE